MKGFVRNVFGGSTTAKPLQVLETPAALRYTLSSFRWHLDSRPPAKVIAVHDYMSSSAAWQQLLNTYVGDLPLSRLSLTDPLEVYAVDLRGHNSSERIQTRPGEDYLLACAADVAFAQRDILKDETHLAGIGFGALVACHAALMAPQSFKSLALFVEDIQQLTACDTSKYNVKEALRTASAADSLAAANEALKTIIPSPLERSLILATVEEQDGKIRFRYSDEVLTKENAITSSAAEADALFPNPVTVWIHGKNCPSSDVMVSFQRRFPGATFRTTSVRGESIFYAKEAAIVSNMLQSFGLLSEMRSDE